MGEQGGIVSESDAEELRLFMRRLLRDVRALEQMLDDRLFETGVRRIGAEQELFLVDRAWRPAGFALELLEELDDDHFTTELGLFNLEFNLEPQRWGGSCLSTMEAQILDSLGRVRRAARALGGDIVLTGILPSLSKSELSLEWMTPIPRYYALNEALTRLRGTEYSFRIKGRDELILNHDNVMLEACNTSFQVHFQVAPAEFARLYNIAQLVAAPVLAAASNSPLLFGRRLWRETRIALFQQSVDTRPPSAHMREQSPRVRFGRQWVDDSVLEILHEDIARYRVLLTAEVDEDPFAQLRAGHIPSLKALRLFNGTIYRWTRPCYGTLDGRPHLRIENRVLPSGPTVVDEMANAAFWLGLMSALAEEIHDIRDAMEFDLASENFLAAARFGLKAQFHWVGARATIPARQLILEELLPRARAGLEASRIDPADVDRYLGVLRERVDTGRTGAWWLLDSHRRLGHSGTRAERLAALTAACSGRQETNEPVAGWTPAELPEAGGWKRHYLRVEQLMTTDLFTVNEREVIDLVACLMDWRHIRHVPVEDNEHRLVGVVSARSLLRLIAQGRIEGEAREIPVSEIMERDVVTIEPEAQTIRAIALMREHQIGCLPVVKDERLIGIITERDLLPIAGELLEEVLHQESEDIPSAP